MKAAALLAVLFSFPASLSAVEPEALRRNELADLNIGALALDAVASPAPAPAVRPERPAVKTRDGRTLKYFTSCRMDGGTARGYVNNAGDAFTIDGYVWFYFFDRSGNLVDKEDEYEYEYVSRGENEEVEYTNAPSGAETCSFNIDGAIETDGEPDSPPPPPGLNYATRCLLDSGTARGWVHNVGDPFEIDGYVWFYFFDEDGRLMDDEDEYEYEYVSRGEDEEVEYTSAPSDARSCAFKIDKAIKRSKGQPTPRRPSGAFAGRKVEWGSPQKTEKNTR